MKGLTAIWCAFWYLILFFHPANSQWNSWWQTRCKSFPFMSSDTLEISPRTFLGSNANISQICTNLSSTYGYGYPDPIHNICYVYPSGNSTATRVNSAINKCGNLNNNAFNNLFGYSRLATFETPTDYDCAMSWLSTVATSRTVLIGAYDPSSGIFDLGKYYWVNTGTNDLFGPIPSRTLSPGASAGRGTPPMVITVDASNPLVLTSYTDGTVDFPYLCEFGMLTTGCPLGLDFTVVVFRMQPSATMVTAKRLDCIQSTHISSMWIHHHY